MKHVSTALVALSRTKLITFYLAVSIHAALLSKNCVSCQNHTPFLFLPTCDRCCHEYLHRDCSLRVITIRMAGIRLGISPKDLSRIPAMLSIPGTYSVGHEVTYRKLFKLVSLMQTMKVGIAVHGKSFTLRNVGKLTRKQLRIAQRLACSSSECLSHDISTLSLYVNAPEDHLCGMTSAGLPPLRPKDVFENQLWGFGCRINFEKHHRTRELNCDTELVISGFWPDKGTFGNGVSSEIKVSISRIYKRVQWCEGSASKVRTGNSIWLV
jgi:hypothetical protein